MIQIMKKKDNSVALVSSDKNIREEKNCNQKVQFWIWKQKLWRIQALSVQKFAKVSLYQLPTVKMRATKSRLQQRRS